MEDELIFSKEWFMLKNTILRFWQSSQNWLTIQELLKEN